MKTTSILLTIMFVCGSAMADTIWDGATWEGAYWGDSDPTQAPYDAYNFAKSGGDSAYFGLADGGYVTCATDGAGSPATGSGSRRSAFRNYHNGENILFDSGPSLLGTRMRVAGEGWPADEHGNYSAIFRAYAGENDHYGIYIARGKVLNSNQETIATLDTTEYHEYLLEMPGGSSGATGNLYIDGTRYADALIAIPGTGYAGNQGLMFGDSSGSHGGLAFWDYVGWATDTVIIPEPMTVTLLGIGGLCTLIRRRR